jgi:hypothetical protein
MWVPLKIPGFLFGVTRAEIERSIEPHSDKRSDVGTTIGSDRDNPEQLGGLKQVTRFLPRGGHGVRVAISRINGGDGFVHAKKLLSMVKEMVPQVA